MPSFEIKDYLKVEFYIPPANTWIWGISKWDGGDLWGGASSELAWTDLLCESFEIETEHGFDVDSGIFTTPLPGTAVIRMQSAEYDPFQNGAIHPGTPVRIQIRGYTWEGPAIPADQTAYIYTGQVESFNVKYDAFGNNTITIQCVDNLPAFLNQVLPTFSTSGSSKDAAIFTNLFDMYWDTALWNTYDYVEGIVVGARTWTEETLGTITNDVSRAGAGLLWTDGQGQINYMNQWNFDFDFAETPYFYFSNVHSTDITHICMSDLDIANDARNTPNQFRLTDTTATTYVIQNQDAIDLYGANTVEADLLLTGSTRLQEFADFITLAPLQQRVNSISFPAIKRDGNMSEFMRVSPTTSIGTAVQVTYNKGSIDIDAKYAVNKVRNFISPDTWLVTLELWQGV